MEQHPARGRPTANQSAQIADRIEEAAWRVLLEVGPEHFSVDRVAHAAHASKQTIYARFSGKLDLLQTVLATRIGMIFAELREMPDTDDIHAAFADMARRSVRSMISTESRMLDRLIDWIDTTLPGDESLPTRVALYEQSRALISQQLHQAMKRWDIVIDDIPEAAAFWLDGILGHVRGLPADDLQRQEWPSIHACYFLRAIRP